MVVPQCYKLVYSSMATRRTSAHSASCIVCFVNYNRKYVKIDVAAIFN